MEDKACSFLLRMDIFSDGALCSVGWNRNNFLGAFVFWMWEQVISIKAKNAFLNVWLLHKDFLQGIQDVVVAFLWYKWLS